MKKLTHIDGDIFKIQGIQICGHQCNCQNIMGSGIAKTVRELHPVAYEADTRAARENTNILGNISIGDLESDDGLKYIVNLYGQNLGTDYRKLYDRKTDYEALFTALQKMKSFCEIVSTEDDVPTVAFPYKMGSDRGGGSWEIVERLIEVAFDNYQGEVIIVHYKP